MPEVSIQQNISGTGNFVVGQGTLNIIQQLPELDREGHRNLAILRDKVKQFWIGGVLEKSVHGEALIALGRQTVAGAVDHPWASTLELPDQQSQLLPSRKKTSEIFYECTRALLILGEPGSGKTITLLELARELIQKSEVDPTQPVPVIFNLSSWSARQPPLMAWLVEELKTKYFVSRKLAELWLQQNRLLLLLDGLDEVTAEARSACVEAIHKHIEEQGSSGIVVCCRIRDYTALPLKLKLNAAICVQPLTSEQIDLYLQRSGESLAALRQAVNDDAVLSELAQTPLVLSIMSLAYQDVPPAQLKVDGLKTLGERREHILEQYVEKMFLRRQQMGRAFSKENTKKWLAGLARQMTQRAQTVFLVEGLQPDWLPRRKERWGYFVFSRGVGGMLLVAALIAALALWLELSANEVLFAVIPVVWAGIVTSCLEPWLLLRRKKEGSSRWKETFQRVWIYGGLSGLMAGVATWLADLNTSAAEPLFCALLGLLAANVFGWLFGLVFGFRANKQSATFDIQTVESLAWSWRDAANCILRGLLIGALVTVTAGFAINYIIDDALNEIFEKVGPIGLWKETADSWHKLLVYLAVGGVTGAALAALFGGLVRVATQSKTRPNEGIRLSWRNAIRAGVPIGLGLGIMLWTAIVLFDDSPGFAKNILLEVFPRGGRLAVIPIGGAISGVFLGVTVALWYGGFDIIQHYTLRLLLWQRGYAPRRLVRFLEHASELIFLQKVGGGHIFVHRLLLEHFAAKESEWSALSPLQKPGT